MLNLKIERRLIRSGDILRDAYFITERGGKIISQPFPTRQAAVAEASHLIHEHADLQMKREQT